MGKFASLAGIAALVLAGCGGGSSDRSSGNQNGDAGARADAGAGTDSSAGTTSGSDDPQPNAGGTGGTNHMGGAPDLLGGASPDAGGARGDGGVPGGEGGETMQGGSGTQGGSPGGLAGETGAAGDANGGEPAGSAGAPSLDECDGEPPGTPCGDQGTPTTCDLPDTCDGAGNCQQNFADFGLPCGGPSASNGCNDPDFCDGEGTCDPGFKPAGTPCGNPQDTDCDNPDSCNGLGSCQPNREPGGTPCGSSASNECDQPDTCNDAGGCETNLAPNGSPCGSSHVSSCGGADACQLGSCLSNDVDDGTVCDDCSAGVGQCDLCSAGACPDSPLCPTLSYPLSTGYASNTDQAGVMFDMMAVEQITLRGFDIDLEPGLYDVSIYVTTSASSYVGVEDDAASWTLLETYSNVDGGLASDVTELERNLELTLAQGQSRGFFITLTGGAGLRMQIGTSAGAVRVSDGLLVLREGIAKSNGGFAGAVTSPRVFSGSVHYTRSVSTTLSGGSAIDGVMFDVDTGVDARLRGLQIVPAATGNFDVELWYRRGSHVGHESAAADWQLVDFHPLVAMEADTPLRLPLTTELILEAQTTSALYVTTEAAGGLRATVGTGVGAAIAGDYRFTVREGTGKSYAFGSSFPDRRVHAILEFDTCPAPTAQQLFLFDGGGKSGALGGRAGIDAMCATAAEDVSVSGWGITSVRGFISVDAGDQIKDMPARYGFPTGVPIKSTDNQKVADDWADLFDGSIDVSLSAAKVLTADYWYTGSSSNGSLHANTCTAWTHGSTLFGGHYGWSGTTSAAWLDTNEATCGLAAYHVLCLGW